MTNETHELLKPAEVGERFRVDPRTVVRWAEKGLIDCVRTPGGHRRYYAEQIAAFLKGGTDGAGD